MDSTRKNRFAFTLIEMLVVILIIGILLGLLMPAIQYAREYGRTTKCLNNQQEIAKALIHYDVAKQRLPGVLSRVNPADPSSLVVNWVMSIFGELGRMDLWQNWANGTGTDVKVNQLICPSNLSADTIGGLSYVVNLGVYKFDSIGNPDYSDRLFRNRASSPAEPDQTLASVQSLTTTVMLSEKSSDKIQAGPWTDIPAPIPLPGVPAGLEPLTFQWPAGLGSNHRGSIIVTYCDGHSEKITP